MTQRLRQTLEIEPGHAATMSAETQDYCCSVNKHSGFFKLRNGSVIQDCQHALLCCTKVVLFLFDLWIWENGNVTKSMAVGALEDLTAQMVLTQISVVPGYS